MRVRSLDCIVFLSPPVLVPRFPKEVAMDNLRKINLVDVIVDLHEILGESKRVASVKVLIFRVICSSMFVVAITFNIANFFYVGPEMHVQTLQAFLLLAHVRIFPVPN